MDDFIISTDILSTMYGSLADAQPAGPIREALRTVRDAIDMGVLPREVLTDVVLGRRPLPQAMADVADVMADSIADDYGAHEDTIADVELLISDCKAAAMALGTTPDPAG